MVRLRRVGGLVSLKPRVYLIGEDGSVVGSAVGRRMALSTRGFWDFSLPLEKVSALESGDVLLPVDVELKRALDWTVSVCRVLTA